jgi:carbamoylphosphate synthase small subunit
LKDRSTTTEIDARTVVDDVRERGWTKKFIVFDAIEEHDDEEHDDDEEYGDGGKCC